MFTTVVEREQLLLLTLKSLTPELHYECSRFSPPSSSIEGAGDTDDGKKEILRTGKMGAMPWRARIRKIGKESENRKNDPTLLPGRFIVGFVPDSDSWNSSAFVDTRTPRRKIPRS